LKKNRVVITGMGVVTPNALGIDEFRKALFDGKSGIKHWKESEELNFRCQLGGAPPLTEEYLKKYLPLFYIQKLENKGILYGCLAGLEAWENAGLDIIKDQRIKDAGMIFGAGALGLDSYVNNVLLTINEGENRKLGSRVIPQCMNSGAAAFLNQILGLGYKTQSNSAACITGSEAVLMGYEEVASGRARLMMCGSTEGDGKFIWGAFDAMRVLCADSNANPEFGTRPMSESSGGFIPSGGSGALVLESLDSAQERGATIYGEILGGAQNCGGMTNGGTMTAPNSEALIECIELAVTNAGISPNEIDLISGHLTSTRADTLEIENWKKGLNLEGDDFPLINTPKSMIGHCIAGAGSIESVASVLQIHHGFVHKNINITEETIHPKIKELIPTNKIPLESTNQEIKTVIKSNFGFGDLNCVLVFRKFQG
jgi:3-oxoacyl-(acyl-carrier-protein) synthase